MIADRPYTNLDSVKKIFQKLIDNIHLKIIFANIAILLSWMFDGEMQVLRTVFSLVLIDVVTGVWAILKVQGWSEFKSREFVVGPIRFFVYIILMFVARSVDKSFPLHWAAPIMDTFIVCTEAKSILENFGKLGYPVPLIMVEKLKGFIQKKE